MTDTSTAQILHMGLDSLTDDAKATEDYSKEVEALLKENGKVDGLFKAKRIDEAIEEILPLEKKARQVSDAFSTSKLCQKIIQMCYAMGDWVKTREMMVVLCRKRGQLRKVVSDITNLGMEYLKPLERGKELHTNLLNTLLDITNGKIFLEVERSRLVSIQAEIKEHLENDIDGAAMLLQEVQVETFSTMDKIEKAKFILNQMRLMLLRSDYVRVQIASRKISEKFLDDDDMQEVKVEYLHYMVQYFLFGEAAFSSRNSDKDEAGGGKKSKDKKKLGRDNNNEGNGNFLEVTKCYKKMFNTKIVTERENSETIKGDKCGIPIPSWKEVLSHWLIYLVLAKNNDDSIELMESTMKNLPRKQLETFENLSSLVKSFQDKKLISWPLKFEGELKAHKVFKGKNLKFEGELKAHKVFKDPIHGPARFEVLRKRVIQHNLRIVSLYYSRIQTDRLMSLLNLSQKEVESELASLVVDGTLYARIDRPEKLIYFGKAKKPEDEMNQWSKSIDKVLDLVREAGHLIGKEKMIQEARSRALKAK